MPSGISGFQIPADWNHVAVHPQCVRAQQCVVTTERNNDSVNHRNYGPQHRKHINHGRHCMSCGGGRIVETPYHCILRIVSFLLMIFIQINECSRLCDPGNSQNCYEHVGNSGTFAAGQVHCEGLGGSLPQLSSSSEDAWFIANVLLNNRVWVGLTDSSSEGNFVWTKDATNNYGKTITGNSGSKDCVVYKMDGNWQAIACTRDLPYIVCMFPKDDAIQDLTTKSTTKTTTEIPTTTTTEAPTTTTTEAPTTATTEAPITTSTEAPITTSIEIITTTAEVPITTTIEATTKTPTETPTKTTTEAPITTTTETPTTTTTVTPTEAQTTTSTEITTTTTETPNSTTIEAPTTEAQTTTSTEITTTTTVAPITTTTEAPTTSTTEAPNTTTTEAPTTTIIEITTTIPDDTNTSTTEAPPLTHTETPTTTASKGTTTLTTETPTTTDAQTKKTTKTVPSTTIETLSTTTNEDTITTSPEATTTATHGAINIADAKSSTLRNVAESTPANADTSIAASADPSSGSTPAPMAVEGTYYPAPTSSITSKTSSPTRIEVQTSGFELSSTEYLVGTQKTTDLWSTTQVHTGNDVTSETYHKPTGPKALDCPALASLSRAQLVGSSRRIGSVVTAVCDGGYVFAEGGKVRTVVCLPSGRWSVNVKDCVAIACDSPKETIKRAITAPVPSQHATRVGHTVTVTCTEDVDVFDQGLGVMVTKCVDAGQGKSVWSREDSTCEKRCPPLSYVLHASIGPSNHTTTISTQITMTCNTGYKMKDGSKQLTATCLDNATWSELGECLVQVCPKLTIPLHATANTTLATYGTHVQVTCNPGYHFPGRATPTVITCQEGEQWSGTLEQCQLIICEDPLMPANIDSTKFTRVNSSSKVFLYGSQVTYTCTEANRFADGYTTKTISCGPDGLWAGQLGDCQTDRCPPVLDVPHSLPSNTSSEPGAEVVYSCQSGYQYVDVAPLYIVCDAGSWNLSSEVTTCSIKSCPPIRRLHASLSTFSTIYSIEVSITCDSGYLANHSSSVKATCLHTAQWDVDVECKPVDCGPVPVIENAIQERTGQTTYGTNVTYSCLDGFWYTRDVHVTHTTCTAAGLWSAVPSECTPLSCPPIPYWDGIIPDVLDTAYGVTVNYTCDNATSFADDQEYHTAYCDTAGQWKPVIESCKALQKTVYVIPLTESENSEVLGTVCMAMVILILAVIILADLPVLFKHFEMLDNSR